MSLVVAFTMGLALWHFTVFMPEHEYRFWGGIVGALLVSVAGAMVAGTAFWLASGRTVGETDLITALVAVPGALVGIAIGYIVGTRADRGTTLPAE